MPRRGSPKKKRVSRASGKSLADFSRKPKPMGNAENPSLRLMGGFPDRVRVTLRYTTKVALTSSVTASTYLWRGNDLYDPDVTSTGGQPNNFDDWMVQYSKFRVHGSRARLHLGSTSTAALGLVSFGVSQSGGTGSVVTTVSSRPRQKVHWVNGGQSDVFDDQRYTTKQVLGMTQSQFEGSDQLIGTASGTPALSWYWMLTQESYDGSTSTSTYGLVIIDYDVEFFSRADQGLDLMTRAKVVAAGREEKKSTHVEQKEERKVARAGTPVRVVHREPPPTEYELVDLPPMKIEPARLVSGFPQRAAVMGSGLGLR